MAELPQAKAATAPGDGGHGRGVPGSQPGCLSAAWAMTHFCQGGERTRQQVARIGRAARGPPPRRLSRRPPPIFAGGQPAPLAASDWPISAVSKPTAVVIGGGPAGLMAAESLSERGIRVDLYDAMPSVGRKFLVAGKGGLNLTHSEPREALLARYGAGRVRLQPMIDAFGPEYASVGPRTRCRDVPWAVPGGSFPPR